MKTLRQNLFPTRSAWSAVAGVVCLVGSVNAESNKPSLATLQEENSRLSRENLKLKESLIASNQREEQVAKSLSRVKTRMGALGKSILAEDENQRLLSALSEIEFLQKRVEKLENATQELTKSYRGYVSTALVSDPDARNKVEASLRQAEVALGERYKPERPIKSGTLQQAQIISIDQESGLIVLNVGHTSEARIGMQFAIKRGNLDIATGIIAEVRPNVSGLLVQELHDKNLVAQLGDRAKVKLK